MNVQTKDRVWRTTNFKLTSHNPRNVSLTCNKFKGAQPHTQISVFWTIERKKNPLVNCLSSIQLISREFKVQNVDIFLMLQHYYITNRKKFKRRKSS